MHVKKDKIGENKDSSMHVEVHLPALPAHYQKTAADSRLEGYYAGLTEQMRELEREMRLLGTGVAAGTSLKHEVSAAMEELGTGTPSATSPARIEDVEG
jgi:hypothetical protein